MVNFKLLKLDGADVGLTLLQELVKGPANGIRKAVNDNLYPLRKIAALILAEDAHALLWHPEKKRHSFASKMHKEAAEALISGPWTTAGMQTHPLQTGRVEKEGQSVLVSRSNIFKLSRNCLIFSEEDLNIQCRIYFHSTQNLICRGVRTNSTHNC